MEECMLYVLLRAIYAIFARNTNLLLGIAGIVENAKTGTNLYS